MPGGPPLAGGDADPAFRAGVLRRFGAEDVIVEELLAYTANPYAAVAALPAHLPLPDEAHAAAWLQYEDEARNAGACEALRRHFVQLRFPIREGISQHEDYQRATRRGDFSAADAWTPGVTLVDPDGVRLVVHATIAGRIPVLTVRNREDFSTLVRAFTERNEPAAVPPAMGACIVSGLNNWHRVAAWRQVWYRTHPGATDADWPAAFRELAARKELYQDRFIILSCGPYSAVSAEDAGLDESTWIERSVAIRREHEFTHYFTWRAFGQFRTHAIDELVADFMGLARGFGTYDPRLARLALGLERMPHEYHAGGRLENYRRSLQEPAFAVVAGLAHAAVDNLSAIARLHRLALLAPEGAARLAWALVGLTLEELASDDMPERVARRLGVKTGRRGREVRVELPDSVDAVTRALEAFDSLLADDPRLLAVGRGIHLVIDEIASNLVKYARSPGTPLAATLAIAVGDDTLTLVFEDNGPPFDPVAAGPPADADSLTQRPVGGLGLHIVKREMDEARYERRNGRNRLTLVRWLPANGGPAPAA